MKINFCTISNSRKLMASDGMVFPQELELVMDVVSSPPLVTATRVSDANTCGVTVADAFNMLQVNNQVSKVYP